MYDFDKDLNTIQKLLIADKEIMRLLDLTGKSNSEIGKRITKKSQWSDLLSSDKRLCLYPLRSRGTRSSILFEEIIAIDCHVPSVQDFQARQIMGKVVDVLNNKRINGRYLTFKGQLGELPTATGFYCFGVHFGYFSPV
ncbi:hypothetical protein [Tissierella sp.]|uniref:hypothetical protein n=1 Tax=Tissierella sp. TaxID=41274 RepID=UPI00285521E5|nr:hypothetical protein [Tissierella sp.]MDR7856081.1 hypothetical protein [Tissierella sp.]